MIISTVIYLFIIIIIIGSFVFYAYFYVILPKGIVGFEFNGYLNWFSVAK